MDKTMSCKDLSGSSGDEVYYVCDDSLSLEAKGLFTMMINLSFEQFWPLTDNPSFDSALYELQNHGYVGEFSFDGWQIRPIIAVKPGGGFCTGDYHVA